MRLTRKARKHRIGVMPFLFKYKYWQKIEEETLCWEDLKWRPLLSYKNYMYAKWFSQVGKTLSALASIVYHKDDMVK